MWIRYFILLLVAFSSGTAVAAGYVAFISLIGIFPKLAEKSKSGKHLYFIEWFIILGISAGNIVSLLLIKLPTGQIGLVTITLFGGIFTGCLIGALAEVLDIYPIISRRFKIRKHLPYIIVGIALGKCLGNLLQFYLNK